MRALHFLLFGTMITNGTFSTTPSPKNYTIQPPKFSNASTASDILNLAASRRQKRVTSRQESGEDIRDNPLECLRVERDNARLLSSGATLSMKAFAAQPSTRTNPRSGSVILIMDYYRRAYDQLAKAYDTAYLATRDGNPVPPVIYDVLRLGWKFIGDLDVKEPSARDTKYLGSFCGIKASKL